MHKRHAEILESLRRGKWIRPEIGGFYLGHRRLSEAAEDAMLASGQLALVRVASRYFGALDYVIHRERLGTFLERYATDGGKVLEVVDPFMGHRRESKKGNERGKGN